MAGCYKIYCIGGEGGFQGADGINPILVEILVGGGDRMWLEAVYLDKRYAPLGKVRHIVPQTPEDKHILMDACIAFFPEAFGECPSLKAAEETLGKKDFWDFNMDGVPEIWKKVRKEAGKAFRRLVIYEGRLERIHSRGKQ